MLLAALSAAGAQGAESVFDRVSRTFGGPDAVVRRGGRAVCAWAKPACLQVDQEQGWMAEGTMDLGTPDFAISSLQTATGDFTLLALHEDGLVLASGRAGGYRPIFVMRPNRELVIVCTRLSPLVALLPQRPRLDMEYLSASVLVLGRAPTESTPYVEVRRLPPGQAWLVRPGQQERRWSTVRPVVAPELRAGRDLARALRQEIDAAVLRSMRSSARVAVKASGGLDSSLILSLVVSFAREGRISRSPEAVAYEFEAPEWHDDRPYLRSLESHLGVHAHRVAPKDAAAFISELMVVDSRPAGSPVLCAAGAIGTIARAHGVDVVLGGEGGDQALDGSLRVFGELARRGKILRALEGALKTRGVFYEGPIERLARFLLFPLVEPLLPRQALLRLKRLRQRLPRWAGPALGSHADVCFPPALISPTLQDGPGERYETLMKSFPFAPFSLARLQEEVVGGYTLRTPLLDDDFLRFAVTLPPLSLLRGGIKRGLMREAMRGLVPEDLRLRETKGSCYWFVEQALREAGGISVLRHLADVRMLADLGLVEPRHFRTLFEEFAGTARDDVVYEDIWPVLSTEAFLREHASEDAARAA